MARPERDRQPKYVMISAVSERFDIHPQTLRLYEREGLITPARSRGNTRLYDEETLDRLEQILTLTRDLGVNLAGVEVILNLRDQMARMKKEMDQVVDRMRRQVAEPPAGVHRRHALVRLSGGPPVIVRQTTTSKR
jgi:MerR family transcriptional regulator, heat shock protein HspR